MTFDGLNRFDEQATGEQARQEVAGTSRNGRDVPKGDAYPSQGQITKWGEKAIDRKVERWIASQYGVGVQELESLAIMGTYLILVNRVNVGTSIAEVLDWSGQRPRWQRRVRQGLEAGIKLGLIERFPAERTGYTIDITTKGERVLEAYDRRFEEIKTELEARRITNILNREAKLMNRATKAREKAARLKASE